jgi:hypothetical protein
LSDPLAQMLARTILRTTKYFRQVSETINKTTTPLHYQAPKGKNTEGVPHYKDKQNPNSTTITLLKIRQPNRISLFSLPIRIIQANVAPQSTDVIFATYLLPKLIVIP